MRRPKTGQSNGSNPSTPAIRNRQPTAGLVQHTNRGGQYASVRCRAVLRRAGIGQSMSRPRNCYDNPFRKSRCGTFKTEMEMTDCEDYRTARRVIAAYIGHYRAGRKNSARGYLSRRNSKLFRPADRKSPPVRRIGSVSFGLPGFRQKSILARWPKTVLQLGAKLADPVARP